MTDLDLKKELFDQCSDFIENRLKLVQKGIAEIQESLMSETKNSAGDKHETGRAMLQLEREKLGFQLNEIEKVQHNLFKLDLTKSSKTIRLGSIVFTSQANYFIAISVGALRAKEQIFFAITPNTPIGLLLMGKTIGDRVVFRDQDITIVRVI